MLGQACNPRVQVRQCCLGVAPRLDPELGLISGLYAVRTAPMKNQYTTFDRAPGCPKAWILAYVCVLHYLLLYLLWCDEGSSAGGGKQSPSKRQLKMVEYLQLCAW